MPNLFQQTEKFLGFANRDAAAAKATARTKKTIMIQHNCEIAKTVMKSGSGNDGSTLLRRSLNSVSGSRKTSSAL